MGPPAHATPPPGGWTVDDLDDLPATGYRHELTDGSLTVWPSPSNLHQAIVGMLVARLADVMPERYEVTWGVEVRFTRQLTRIPDVIVVHSSDDLDRNWFDAAEVVLAVEVESTLPGSYVEERVTRPAIYARFRIPHYWRIEPSPLRITMYRLGGGEGYEVVSTGNDRLDVDEPFEVHLALADLLPRWAK